MRLAQTLCKALISLLILAIILWSANLRAVLHAFGHILPGPLCSGLLMLLLQVLVLAARWREVTAILNAPLGSGQALRITFISQFFNQALPSSVGGDAIRIWLARRTGMTLRQAFQGVIGDRAVATAMLLVFVLAGLAAQRSVVGAVLAVRVVDMLAGVMLGGFVAVLLLAPVVSRHVTRPRAARAAVDLALATRTILSDRGRTAGVLMLSALNHTLAILGMMMLARALDVQVGWPAFFVLVPIVLLLSMIPVSIGGWGVREGVMVAAFAQVGVPTSTALTLSLLYGLGLMVASLPGGVIWLVDRKRADHAGPAAAGLAPVLSAE